ncbi:acetone carboxylase subunit gamma [Martelella soudanensis]|uniref:acetone carboxylase subunit gamma n=1 Tax=unclassified Martelella TaxID=2629616 RepID=UPI0015DDFD9B|nr:MULTISPECIES: acetone carboxylase subunit gamma [unclassified Martelella]
MTVRITENLSIDLEHEAWCCAACGHRLTGARENYKTGCLVAEVPMEEAHPPMVEGAAFSFTPHPDFCRLVEFYCPGCGTVLENEYLPPGHPITHDIELDIDALKARRSGNATATDGRAA